MTSNESGYISVPKYTAHQARYFAEQIMLKRPPGGLDSLTSAMSGVKVDLNPHQVDAALFALRSPLSNGALLADEVGLGKTIEAGLVLAQFWSERKRKILLIVPASLRTQWRTELEEKFYIKSHILESVSYNSAKKMGALNPFDIHDDAVVICSYPFASQKMIDIHAIPWDLVIIDEAHRLRNVYKKSNVTGNKLKIVLDGKRKLLLTATPLQNNLMELFGLVSIIDDHVFGDSRTFRDMYVNVANETVRNRNLKERLRGFCKRTLRKQVTEYVKYTSRIAILQEYTPTADEEKLYNFVSEYLRSDRLYALPQGQRNLITLVLRKLLASSSFAISGTLNSLVQRLEEMLQGIENQLVLDDYDTFDELEEEDEEEDIINAELEADKSAITEELERLREYAALAESIDFNSKGENLLTALEKGFEATEGNGGKRKAVIFTESRRTQDYLLNLLLEKGGYTDKDIVFLNGSNSDPISKRIYTEWKERHKGDGAISGSRQADMKAAVVEEFRDRASILIGTEAAAEGINLQFCSLVVNYDLPWNPQRIEQRIGRCHRYGQKNDVVVINFLNRRNAADVRVYELLAQKFQLFDGLFGSSDEVLGSIEAGVDFEKRIANIYQDCKTADDIQLQFDLLQEELADRINEKMTATRQSILENFDEDVAALLKECNEKTLSGLDKFTRWLHNFFIMHGAERVEPLDQWRFAYTEGGHSETFNLRWQDAEVQDDIFLRRDYPLYAEWLNTALAEDLPSAHLRFDFSESDRNISFLNDHPGLRGMVTIDKLIYTGVDTEEHLMVSVTTEDGTLLDDDLIDRIMELTADATVDYGIKPIGLEEVRQKKAADEQAKIEQLNKQYYIEECAKLDAYSEDLKEGLQRELKELRKEISEKKKAFKHSTDRTLEEMVAMKDEINRLQEKEKVWKRDLFDREDEIERANDALQEEILTKLTGSFNTENVMTFTFEIV